MTEESWLTAGSLLIRAADPRLAAHHLIDYLVAPDEGSRRSLEDSGVSPRIADDFRSILPSDRFELSRACDLGAVWVEGRRSAAAASSWEPVVSGRGLDPKTFDRLTAETMIGLIMGARREIRLFGAYVDRGGLRALSYALIEAMRRGSLCAFGYRYESDRTGAVDDLVRSVEEARMQERCLVFPITDDLAFPHLKLLAVDGERAYIGSANVTFPALTTNLELGALVEGPDVRVYEQLFDELLSSSANGLNSLDRENFARWVIRSR
jgi:PLD-like domain